MPPSSKTWYERPMDAQNFVRRTLRGATALGVIVYSGVFVLGCEEGKANAADPAPAKPGAAEPAVTAAKLAPGVGEGAALELKGEASYSEDSFRLRLSAPAKVKAGELTEYVVTLEAGDGYKVNDEYPIKFKFAASAGVKPESETVRKAAAKVEKKKATMPVKATVAKPGKASIAGKFSFSVCTEERCLIEKRELLVSVDAS